MLLLSSFCERLSKLSQNDSVKIVMEHSSYTKTTQRAFAAAVQNHIVLKGMLEGLICCIQGYIFCPIH